MDVAVIIVLVLAGVGLPFSIGLIFRLIQMRREDLQQQKRIETILRMMKK